MRRLLYRTCYNRAPYPARYMLIPSRQGVCLLHRIGRPVISARDPAFMPRDMIQDCLDHVRLNTDISHSGRRRPAQIVVCPVRQGQLGIERLYVLDNGKRRQSG